MPASRRPSSGHGTRGHRRRTASEAVASPASYLAIYTSSSQVVIVAERPFGTSEGSHLRQGNWRPGGSAPGGRWIVRCSAAGAGSA